MYFAYGIDAMRCVIQKKSKFHKKRKSRVALLQEPLGDGSTWRVSYTQVRHVTRMQALKAKIWKTAPVVKHCTVGIANVKDLYMISTDRGVYRHDEKVQEILQVLNSQL